MMPALRHTRCRHADFEPAAMLLLPLMPPPAAFSRFFRHADMMSSYDGVCRAAIFAAFDDTPLFH